MARLTAWFEDIHRYFAMLARPCFPVRTGTTRAHGALDFARFDPPPNPVDDPPAIGPVRMGCVLSHLMQPFRCQCCDFRYIDRRLDSASSQGRSIPSWPVSQLDRIHQSIPRFRISIWDRRESHALAFACPLRRECRFWSLRREIRAAGFSVRQHTKKFPPRDKLLRSQRYGDPSAQNSSDAQRVLSPASCPGAQSRAGCNNGRRSRTPGRGRSSI